MFFVSCESVWIRHLLSLTSRILKFENGHSDPRRIHIITVKNLRVKGVKYREYSLVNLFYTKI